jgi:hypothetical protein
MPFVQGQLRKEYLSFKIETSCAHTGRPMSIEIDSNLKVQQIEKGANPYIFVPSIDSVMMKEPSIVDLF